MDFIDELKVIATELERLFSLRKPITQVELTRWNNMLNKKVEIEEKRSRG